MRSKSQELMNKILKFAEEYYLDNGYSPAASAIVVSHKIVLTYSLFFKSFPKSLIFSAKSIYRTCDHLSLAIS